jgi:hypothetical protein
MKKILFNVIMMATSLVTSVTLAAATQQSCSPLIKLIVINKTLIQKINTFERSSANANQVEKLIGPACACITTDASPNNEAWTCQWKADFSSNRLENTLNITFAAGSISNITAIGADGTRYSAQSGTPVKVYK